MIHRLANMLLAAMSIKEKSVLSPTMGKQVSSCDVSVNEQELSCSSESREVCDLREAIRSTYEYYSGKDKDARLYRDGPETLRKKFIGATIENIKAHPWTDEANRLLDALHWSEKINFEEVKRKGRLTLSYALLNQPADEAASECYELTVTRNSVYEWWNEYRAWKKFGDGEGGVPDLEDPGTHEEFRERFLASGLDERGNPQLTRVFREERGRLVEKYIYVEEKFIVQKHIQAPLVVALYQLCNFVPRTVLNTKHWVNSSSEERNKIVQEEIEYFEDITKMMEMMHAAHNGKDNSRGDGDDKTTKHLKKKTNRVSPFTLFCQEKNGGEEVSAEDKKKYGGVWRKLTDEQKAKYGEPRAKPEKRKAESLPPRATPPPSPARSPPPPSPEAAPTSPSPSKKHKQKSENKGVLVGRTLESVAEELDRFFNSNFFEDEEKKFVWNMLYKNMRAAAKNKKTTDFNETCLKKAYEAYAEDPGSNQVRFLRMIDVEPDHSVKSLVQTFNVLFSRPAPTKEDKDDFIF